MDILDKFFQTNQYCRKNVKQNQHCAVFPKGAFQLAIVLRSPSNTRMVHSQHKVNLVSLNFIYHLADTNAVKGQSAGVRFDDFFDNLIALSVGISSQLLKLGLLPVSIGVSASNVENYGHICSLYIE